jgi:exonuclease III
MAFNLKDLFDEYDFDFIGLQETMKKQVDVPICREFDPNNKYTWIWSPSVGKSGGILCGIKSSRFDVNSFKVSRHFVKANVFDKKLKHNYWLVLVYGAAQLTGRESFLVELADICTNLLIPTVIGGDFNILRFGNEKNKPGGTDRFSDMFNAIINTHALREIRLSRG